MLTEDGRPQTITSFEAVETRPEAPAPASLAGSPIGAAAKVGRPTSGRTLVIVFDDLGLGTVDGERARAAVLDFVRSEVASGDQLRLVSTSGDVRWTAHTDTEIQDLVELVAQLRGRAADASSERMSEGEACRIQVDHDPRALAVVADRYRAAGEGTLPAAALEKVVGAEAGALCHRASTRGAQTLAALGRAASSLEGVHGRKAVVLVSPGIVSTTASPEYRRVVEACRAANVAVYLLSAAGVEPPRTGPEVPLIGPSLLPDSQRPPGEIGDLQESMADTFPVRQRAEAAGGDNLAVDTGGFVVRNTNDLAGGLGRIAEDVRAYYLLGYVPANGTRDGKYRKIAVRLAPREATGRRTVRARRGYYGPSDATANRTPTPEEDLRRLLDSPIERGEIPVRLAALVFEDSTRTRGAIRCLLVSEVDSHTAFDIAFETVPRRGGRGEHVVKQVKPAGEAPVGGHVRVEQELALAPGVHQAAAAVRDAAGRSGSRSIRLDVPTTGAFRISTPVVAAGSGPGNKAAPRATPAERREFASGDHVQVAFDVYGARKDPASGHPRVSMGCAIVRSGQGSRRATLRPVGQDQQDALHRTIDFELAGVGVGEYAFMCRLADDVSAQQVSFSAPFAVTAAAAARAVEPAVAQPTRDPEVASLLELAGSYVVGYEQALHDLAAEEEYTQNAPRATSPETVSYSTRPGMGPAGAVTGGTPGADSASESRRTRADLVFARLPPPIEWGTFRDVFEVDGALVRDRDGRLERAFRDSPRTAVAQARAILAESARFNIGPERTVNLPTLPLLFLHPSNQPRFDFERRATSDGGATVELAFREQARPTVIQSSTAAAAGDLPAEGRFWINARRGTVLRSEVRFRFDSGGTAAIATTYRAEPRLAMWVPVEMKERYQGSGFGAGTEAVARYSRFRKFQVTTEEKVRVPEK
ncbi:MAG TPA: VWA domain-containing protein [Vicinamibacteria bacterium]|nr:VWA domain-containing protein [Vicinamibacteria bacterium]